MKQNVMLHIKGIQAYEGQDPDTIELTTEGTMERLDGGWNIAYEESDLTGLKGATTTFRVEDGTVDLRRTGALQSQMFFQEGVSHESLYQIDAGALLVRVCAQRVFHNISEDGGTIQVSYSIEIENTMAGTVDYFITIAPMG